MKNLRTSLALTALLAVLAVPLLTGGAQAADKEKAKEHGYLGVMLQNVSTSMAKALQLGEDEGAMINEVVDESPAAEAGLQAGDVLLKFAGQKTNDYAALTRAVRATAPGEKVKLEILRNGQRQTVEVELGKGRQRSYTYTVERDGDGPHAGIFGEGGEHENVWFSDGGREGMKKLHRALLGADADRGFLGVEFGDLGEQLGDYFGVEDGKGALINTVRKDSPAAEAGLKAGDVVTSLDGESIEDAGDVRTVMAKTKPGQDVEVKFVRKGSMKSEKVKLGEVPEGNFKFDFDFDFEDDGGDHDVRIIAPGASRKVREIHRLHGDSAGLDELRSEMDALREELKKLKQELKK